MPSSLPPTVRRHEHLATPPSSLPFALYPHPHTARFHHFRAIIEPDQPFRQTGNVDNQACFRTCQVTEDRWWWLQTCRPTRPSDDNAHFDVCMSSPATTSVDAPTSNILPPLPCSIGDCDAEICTCDGDDINDGKRAGHNDTQLFAVGAEVMWTYQMTSVESSIKLDV